VDALREEGIFLELIAVSCPLEISQDLIAEAARKGPIFSVEDHNIHAV
jgi:transketolase